MRDGLPPPVAPEWIQWNVGHPAPTEEEQPSSPEEDPFDKDERWEPFLQPDRKRARRDLVEESAEEDDEGEEVVFPYPVDTKVARDFGEHGIFWGVIEKHYPDDPNLCLVRFTERRGVADRLGHLKIGHILHTEVFLIF